MSSGNGGWGFLKTYLGGQDRATLRRWAAIWLVMVAIGWFWLIPNYVAAQDKKEEAPKPAAEAPKPAEAQKAPEPAGPKPDPNGGSTGDGTFAQDGNGNLFQVPDPGPAPDATDPNYAALKKAWDAK